MEYRMFSNTELKNFRSWMSVCPFDRSAEGAYDSKPRRAKDEEGEAAARGAELVLRLLEEKLGPEAFAELCERICGESGEPESEAEDTDPATEFDSPEAREMDDKPAKDRRKAKDMRRAKDEPADFPGKPSTGTAMDAAADPRFDYLRDAAKVKPDNGSAFTDRSSQTRRAPSTANGERSFGEMYGNAALAIKVR